MLLIAGAALVPVPAASAATSSCSFADPADPNGGAYNEPRVLLESQSWWIASVGEPFPGRHIHVSTCFPWAGLTPQPVLTGKVPFNIKVQLHSQPAGAYITDVRIQIATSTAPGGITVGLKTWAAAAPDNSCATGDCTFWFPFTVNTALSDHDGLEEFRFQVFIVQPGGSKQLATTGWQAKLKNGKSAGDYRSSLNYTEARGWYTTHEYENARLTSAAPTATVPVPSTSWTTNWKLAPGSLGEATTHTECAVDADYHNGFNGTVVSSTTAAYTGPVTVQTAGLAAGVHKLICRTEAASKLAPVGTKIGVEAIRFLFGTPPPTVVAPTVTPASGTYATAQQVTMTAAPGTTIRYTTDGTTVPTATTGTVYTGVFTVAPSQVVMAVAVDANKVVSPVVRRDYTTDAAAPAVRAPAVSPAAGTYTTAQQVTMTAATGTTIRYTVDGTTVPTATTGTVYTGPFPVGTSQTVMAVAVDANTRVSAVTRSDYTIAAASPTVTPPTVTLASGTFTTAQQVTMSAAPDRTIRYTVGNGTTLPSDPSATTGTVYTGPFRVGASQIIKAVAIDATTNAVSSVARRDYTIAPGTTPLRRTQNVSANADTYVDGGGPTSSFGGSESLLTNNSPVQITYYRFTVPAGAAPPTAARLRLFNAASSATADTVQIADSSDWDEPTLNYDQRLTVSAWPGTTINNASGPNEAIIPAAQLIPGREVTFIVARGAGPTSPVERASKENRAVGKRPQLVLTF